MTSFLGFVPLTLPDSADVLWCKFSGGESFQPPLAARAGDVWYMRSNIPAVTRDPNTGEEAWFIVGPEGGFYKFPRDTNDLQLRDPSNLAPSGAGWAVAWLVSRE